MIVTLVTDASFCIKISTAAWAADARSERGKFFGGNVLQGSFTSNNSAEMKAVAHALRAAIERGIIADGDEVRLQTDSQFVAQRLHPNYMTIKQKNRVALRGHPERPKNVHLENFGRSSTRVDILAIIEKHSLKFSVKVSSKGIHDVDQAARKLMKKGRAEKLGAKHGRHHRVVAVDDATVARLSA